MLRIGNYEEGKILDILGRITNNRIHKWDAHQVKNKNKYGSVRTYSTKMVTFEKKLLIGFQTSKDVDGIEANFQIAFWKKTRKKYEKVATIEEQPKLEVEEE